MSEMERISSPEKRPSPLPSGTRLLISAVRALLNMAEDDLNGVRRMDDADLELLLELDQWFREHLSGRAAAGEGSSQSSAPGRAPSLGEAP